ncbi:MAG: hypothetical protein AAF432_07160 [Planctomycetota bacterium]
MRINRVGTFGVGSLLLTATMLSANQDLTPDPLPVTKGQQAKGASKAQAMATFLQSNPGTRFTSWETSQRIWGKSFGGAANPVAAAEQFRTQHTAMLGVDAADLVPDVSQWREQGHVQPVMFDPVIGDYKFTAVYYKQQRDGVDVNGSRLTVLVSNATNKIVMVNPDVRELGDFRPPALAAEDTSVTPKMRQKVRKTYGNLAIMRPERKEIFAGANVSEKVPARLADVVLVTVGPEQYRVVTDAETGEILHSENLICFGGISGTVEGLVTSGIGSEQCEDELATPLPYLEVTSGGNSTFTDVNGNFTLPGGALSTGATLRGEWFEVIDFATSVATESTTANPADLLFNSANTDPLIRAQVNTYADANRVRDYTLSFNPAYPGLQINQFPINVNRTDNFCPGNAWFDPTANGGNGSINFCQEGGGSPNTAWSSVIMHEYGHNLVNKAGSGQGQYGEGMSDCVQSLILNTNLLGVGFFGSCAPNDALRDPVANFRSFPCSGSSHDCGQLISGCVWDTIQAMEAVDPVNGRAIVGNLTINSILLHSGSSIDPSITTDFLTLDDNDGDLSNGTPNEAQILAGFTPRNMAPIPAPTNDDCGDAIEICPGVPESGTLIGTTSDGSSSCGDTGGASDAWFAYRPMSNGTLTASLCTGTDFDTVISLHTDCPGTSSNQLACDDDGCGSTGGPSSITTAVTAGETYYIRVTGWQGAVGNYTLNVTGPDCEPIVPPALAVTLPDGAPETLIPGVSTPMTVQIDDGAEVFSGNGSLVYRYDGGSFLSVPLAPLGGNLYEALFPPAECASVPEFYITADGDGGTTVSLPFDAPASFLTTIVGVKEFKIDDNFESDLGWTAINNGASSGDWQRGIPVNDPGWDHDPVNDGDGSSRAYMTQNQTGNTDVDSGSVTLVSPTIDMSASGAYTINYLYYLKLTNEDGTDRLLVEASSNGDAGPWTQVALHTTDGGLIWRANSISQSDLDNAGVVLTANMKIRFTANDGDAQSIVEAGVDGFMVDVVDCNDVVSSVCAADCAPDNGDGTFGNSVINIDDLLAVINAFGGTEERCDIAPDNGDGTFGNGIVNIDDVLEVINAFGPCPE